MKDKIYSKEEAFSLLYHEQKALLDDREIYYKSNAKETTLVRLIIDSNPTHSPKPSQNKGDKDSIFVLTNPDKKQLKKVLEIARAGFPEQDLITFIDKLKKQI